MQPFDITKGNFTVLEVVDRKGILSVDRGRCLYPHPLYVASVLFDMSWSDGSGCFTTSPLDGVTVLAITHFLSLTGTCSSSSSTHPQHRPMDSATNVQAFINNQHMVSVPGPDTDIYVFVLLLCCLLSL